MNESEDIQEKLARAESLREWTLLKLLLTLPRPEVGSKNTQ